jgi:antitoxin VapB
MNVANIVKDGQRQMVRLPDKFRFSDDKVFVKRIGNAIILIPYHDPWRPLFDSLDKFSDDFMDERNQQETQGLCKEK